MACLVGEDWAAPAFSPGCLGGQALCAHGPGMRRQLASFTLGHLIAAQAMVLHGLRFAIVLEDDAFFLPGFPGEVRRLLRQLETVTPSWDFVSLGRCFGLMMPLGEQVSPNLWFTRAISCGHGQLVSQAGARRLLSSLPLRAGFDNHVNWMAAGDVALLNDYPDRLRNNPERLRPGTHPVEIFWAHPPLVAQWPVDHVEKHWAAAAAGKGASERNDQGSSSEPLRAHESYSVDSADEERGSTRDTSLRHTALTPPRWSGVDPSKCEMVDQPRCRTCKWRLRSHIT